MGDLLSLALCLSVGNIVAWLIALYSSRGVQHLLWDITFGVIGAVLCGMAVAWIDRVFVVPAIVTVGFLCSAVMIYVGNLVRLALTRQSSS